MELSVVELFAGVGGFRVGLNHIKEFDKKTGVAIEQGYWKFVWANQWEPSTKVQPAFDCYKLRFNNKDETHVNLDISEIDKNDIPNHSLLVAGFPCQDYSVARTLSKEQGIKGKKGSLWWEIVEVVKHKNPPFILLENVDRLLKSPAKIRGRDFAVMLSTLDSLGYIVQWRVINAGEYSMPQRRRRVFILAARKDTKYGKSIMQHKNIEEYLVKDGFFNELFPVVQEAKVKNKSFEKYKDIHEISEKFEGGKFLTAGIFLDKMVMNFDAEAIVEEYYPLGKVIEDARKFQQANLEDYVLEEQVLEKWRYLKGAKKIPRIKPNGDEYFFAEGGMCFPDRLDIPARTMLTSESTTNRSSHIIKDIKLNEIRKITEVEAEALQMFPYDWTNTGMSKRQRYFMMGNALVTGIISRLEPKLRKIVENE